MNKNAFVLSCCASVANVTCSGAPVAQHDRAGGRGGARAAVPTGAKPAGAARGAAGPARGLWLRCEWNQIPVDALRELLAGERAVRGLLSDIPAKRASASRGHESTLQFAGGAHLQLSGRRQRGNGSHILHGDCRRS